MEKAEEVPPALREPVVNHDWFPYIYTSEFCVYIIDLLQKVNVFHRVSLHLIWKKVPAHPILTCFVVDGKPSCLYQLGEAPACHFCSSFLNPNVFHDICISCWSFMQHAIWPARSAWSGLMFWCSSLPGIFTCSQWRAGLKKQLHPFLMVSPPLSLALLPLSL